MQSKSGVHADNPAANELVRQMKAQLAARSTLIGEQREMVLAMRASQAKAREVFVDQLSEMGRHLGDQLFHVKEQRRQCDAYTRELDRLLRQAKSHEARSAKKLKRTVSSNPRSPAPSTPAPVAPSTPSPSPGTPRAPTPAAAAKSPSHSQAQALDAAASLASPARSSATPPKWDVRKCGQFGHLSNLHRAVTTMGNGWNVVVSTHPVDAFAVRVTWPATCSATSSPVIAIGFTREPNCWKIPVNNPPRSFPFHKTGWFINVNKGTMSTCDGHDEDPCGVRLKSGDIMSATFDFTGESITFAQQLAPPREGHQAVFTNVRSNALYPALVSFDSGIHVEFVELER